MKELADIIKDIERGTLNENNEYQEGVIVVDSIDGFMMRNRATHLRDLDKALSVDGTS